MSHLGETTLGTQFLDLVKNTTTKLEQSGINVGQVSGQLSNAAMTQAAMLATDKPLVLINRARAAALADYGYEKLAVYDRWRPTIFAATASLCALSIAMLVKRRRVPEAVALYTGSAALTGAAAYLTRPAALRPAPAPMPPAPAGAAPGAPPAPGALAQVLGWTDRRVQKLSDTRPGWEATTWRRLARDVGFGTLDPYADVLLTRNTR